MKIMPKALDLTGQKFNKLTAIRRAPSKSGKTYWLCKCECGVEKEIQTSHLVSGTILSCGCLKGKNVFQRVEGEITEICPICNCKFITNIQNRKYCYSCMPENKQGRAPITWKKRAVKHQLVLYKGGKCEKCGYDKCEGALQFHHLDPSKKEFALSDINFNTSSFNMEMLKREVDKCQLLCANCHAEQHFLSELP